MRITLKETRLGLRNSSTRIPFRYGSACLTRCPQAVLSAKIEAGGKLYEGFSGDCLPPSWFDKSPGKSYALQIEEMLNITRAAQETFADEFRRPIEFFPGWLAGFQRVQKQGAEQGLTPLLVSFGVSMVERAMLDAMARAAGLSFSQAVRSNLYAISPGEIHAELSGRQIADWLPPSPRTTVFVRHTVGLGDPLTTAEIPPEERLDDGFPQALEEYIQHSGVRFFKIKVSNQLEHDVARLKTIAALIENRRGSDYRVTLDGNEQYKTAAQFDELIATIQNTPPLHRLWNNTLVVEQPLDRRIALSSEHTAGIRELATHKPVIIDESDGDLNSYSQAIELGYRGVSSKNCKGPIKSLLNAGLTWRHNNQGKTSDFLMTGEDLCTVGVVPVQSDLCLIALLGLEHVERNGHHFQLGLSYLPADQHQAALSAHGDFYRETNGVTAPRLEEGHFEIGSLQCVGFGFAALPDMDSMQSPDHWQYASLGLDD